MAIKVLNGTRKRHSCLLPFSLGKLGKVCSMEDLTKKVCDGEWARATGLDLDQVRI